VDKCCPHCGQTLPADYAVENLTTMQRAVFDRVRRAGKHGIEANALFDFLYGADPNGGPMFSTLAVHVSKLNRKLAPIGKQVMAGRGYKPACYRVVDL
jgi:hypothetical protein